MSDRYDYPMLYRIAKSYYVDNLSQEQIAKCESISRPHVSRILAKARESGVVKFQVQMPKLDDTQQLAELLCERLGLQDVRLACVPRNPAMNKGTCPVALRQSPQRACPN